MHRRIRLRWRATGQNRYPEFSERERFAREHRFPAASWRKNVCARPPASASHSFVLIGSFWETAKPPSNQFSAYRKSNPLGTGLIPPQESHQAVVIPHMQFVVVTHPDRLSPLEYPTGRTSTSRPSTFSAFSTLPISAVSFPRSNSDRNRVLRFERPDTVSSVRCLFLRCFLASLPSSGTSCIRP